MLRDRAVRVHQTLKQRETLVLGCTQIGRRHVLVTQDSEATQRASEPVHAVVVVRQVTDCMSCRAEGIKDGVVCT